MRREQGPTLDQDGDIMNTTFRTGAAVNVELSGWMTQKCRNVELEAAMAMRRPRHRFHWRRRLVPLRSADRRSTREAGASEPNPPSGSSIKHSSESACESQALRMPLVLLAGNFTMD